MQVRSRSALLASLALALMLWAGLREHRDMMPPADPVELAGADPSTMAQATARPQRQERSEIVEPEQTPPVRTVTEARLIEEVSFTPRLPCAGDTVRVTTHLRPEAADAKVFVNGQPGSPQVLVASEVGRQPVRILVRTWGDEFERRDVVLDVQECSEASKGLRARAVANVIGERRYAFHLVPAPEGEVQWQFGDGTARVGSHVTHRYSGRNDRTHSTYLVRATYEGPSATEQAYVAVTHVEPAGVAARTAFPIIENEGERFIGWDPHEGIRTRRFMHNTLATDVSFEVAEVQGFPCNGGSAIAMQLPAAEVADLTQLRAGEAADVEVHVSGRTFDTPICQMLVRLVGQSEGRITTSMFALDTGVPDERAPVEDDDMLRIIGAIAAERGEATPITAEDIAAYRAARGES